MRAYRRMMATDTHAYRNMMYTRYPNQFGQDIRGFVNDSVLQPNGPAEDLIRRVLEGVIAGNQQNVSTATMVAKTEASSDQDLTATLGKTREILKTLKVEEPKDLTTTAPPTSPTLPNPGIKDFSHFEDTVP